MSVIIYTSEPSPCCEVAQIVLRSREGGFITQNCQQCGKPSSVRLSDLPPNCPICGSNAKQVMIDRNYGYDCPKCGKYEVGSIVPHWSEEFGYDGFAIPGVDYEL